MHTGHATGRQHLPRCLAALEPGQQHAAGLVGQVVADQVLFFGKIVVIVADQHLEPARAHDLMNGFQRIDEQLVGQRRDQHHHRLAARRRQGTGRRVGHIAKARRGSNDLFHRLRRNRADPAQGARSGNRGNPGKPGHFSQSGTTGSTGADAGHGELYFRLAKNGERALR
ncbi:hypothetical protein D3C75_931160 [compost metagenome]